MTARMATFVAIRDIRTGVVALARRLKKRL